MRLLSRRAPTARKPLRPIRVAAVVDEFTRASLDPDVTLWSLDARTWRLELPIFRPDLLFVESAWRGRRDSWRRKIAAYPGHDDDTLARLVAHCRHKGIPTVFWNKEDPVHFDRFADAARLFDVVFTTDEGRVADYERLGGPATVRPLPFAAQPDLYHPDGVRRPVGAGRSDRICFAGSYGEPQFPERRAALEMLLDAAADLDLHIYDRNAAQPRSEKSFPPRFAPHLRGALDYRALADEYRACKVALNVNSVTDSKTMFSRRVFEMLACGACVVSTPSTGIEALFGALVPQVSSTDEARATIRRFLDDEPHRARTSAAGTREVMLRHTYEDRLRAICDAAGVSLPAASSLDFAALAFVDSRDDAERLIDLLARQDRPAPALVVGLHGADESSAVALSDRLHTHLGAATRITIVDTDGFPDDRAAARHAATLVAAPRVACIPLDLDLPDTHLGSLVACARFTDADLVAPALSPDDAHHHTTDVDPRAVLLSTTALATHGWSSRPDTRPALRDAYASLSAYASDGGPC